MLLLVGGAKDWGVTANFGGWNDDTSNYFGNAKGKDNF